MPPEEELKHFKAVVRSAMMDVSKVLGHIELLVHGTEIEETNVPAGSVLGLHPKTM